MKFAQPHLFNLLWLVLGIFFLFWWSYARRKSILAKYITNDLVSKVVKNFNKGNYFLKYILIVLVLITAIIALARPQWGFEWQEVKRKGIDILVVIDTSKSMLTQDVKPNRLERTKLAVKDLIKKLKGDRIGLIAFAGEAFLMCPLTTDYNGFTLSLNDIGINSVPRGGTNLEKAIRVALDSFDKAESKQRTVIIVTDGDNLEGDPVGMAKKAKANDVKIYTIGIGTQEGELIQVGAPNQSPEFLKDSNGNFVKSRLNERLLQDISLSTDAIYIKSSGAEFGLDLIYERDLANIEKTEFDSRMQKRYIERFQIPLALAIILLLFETCLTTRRKLKS